MFLVEFSILNIAYAVHYCIRLMKFLVKNNRLFKETEFSKDSKMQGFLQKLNLKIILHKPSKYKEHKVSNLVIKSS